jgi:hypothetical protein
MASSILNSDDGVVSGTAGLKTQGGDDGILKIQTNGTDRVTVNSSGNVGIGTSSPTSLLQAQVNSAGNTPNLLSLVNNTGAAANATGVTLWMSGRAAQADSDRGTFIRAVTTDASNSHVLLFGTSPSSAAPTERMRIDSSGGVFMGTSARPTGSTGGSGFSPQTASRMFLELASTITTSANLVAFINPNGTVGNITTSGSATAYNTSSDYRLKHDIQPMQNALATVAKLKPVTYKWNADNSQSQGFIAHELQEVVPECVTGEKDAVDADGNLQYQGIDTSFLVATLTAAIQELKAELDTVKAELETLKGN